jgi:hypothetical protein
LVRRDEFAQEASFVERHDSTTDVLAPATVSRLAILAAAPTADTSSSATRSPEAAGDFVEERGGSGVIQCRIKEGGGHKVKHVPVIQTIW